MHCLQVRVLGFELAELIEAGDDLSVDLLAVIHPIQLLQGCSHTAAELGMLPVQQLQPAAGIC